MPGEAVKVEDWPVRKLKPYSNNPRRNKHVTGRMVASLEEFGFRIPVIARTDGTVVDGHLRLRAAKKMGMKTVPVISADDLSEAQVRAFRLMVNQSATWAEWDEDKLREELESLEDMGFDLSLTGFSEEELGAFEEDDDPDFGDDTDRAAPVEPDTISQMLDIWQLGKHRLMCGDSTDRDHVAQLLNGYSPNIMVTDPPYGVDYKPGWRGERLPSVEENRTTETLPGDSRGNLIWTDSWNLFPGAVCYVWSPGLHYALFSRTVEEAGFQIRSQIIWFKNCFSISRGHYHFQHEPCIYGVRPEGKALWIGGRKQATVWQIDRVVKSETGHPTQKPLECMLRPIQNHEGSVYDPFVGSGTTILAAEKVGRSCFAMEIEPRYCDAAVRRWEELTGENAVRL